MNTTNFQPSFKHIRKNYKNSVACINYGLTVAQNIADMIPKQWELKADDYMGDIKIVPKGDALTADRFDKILSILSRVFLHEPDSRRIDKKQLYAIWHVRRPLHFGSNLTDWSVQTMVEVVAMNTESCEVITETVMEAKTVTVLTGYCKAIAEKHYLNER